MCGFQIHQFYYVVDSDGICGFVYIFMPISTHMPCGDLR